MVCKQLKQVKAFFFFFFFFTHRWFRVLLFNTNSSVY